mmetsp:Transcript_23113/g.31648  ORF Transcript_23113/g.31648 Transcript_23113/m.31648 type:complete len:1549 (-) Transcript_23113:69-4715(-)
MESKEYQNLPFDQNFSDFALDNFLGSDTNNDSESEDNSVDEDDGNSDQASRGHTANSDQASRGNTAMSIETKPYISDESRKIDLGKQLLEEENAIAKETIRQLKARLIRRTNLVGDIRSYYLRDVVTIKQILEEVLAGTEKEAVMAEYAARLPSLDMTQHLTLHAPSNCELRVSPCDHCGGKVDAVLADSDEVVKLKDYISIMKGKEERFRLKIAELDAINERTSKEQTMNALSHSEEKKVLYSEMKKLREESKKHSADAEAAMQIIKKMRQENQRLQLESEEIMLSVNELAEARAEIRKLKNRLEEEMHAARSQFEKTNLKLQEMSALKGEVRAMALDLEAKSQELATYQHDCAEQKQRLERLESEKNSLAQEKSFLTTRIGELDDKLYFANQAVADLSNMQSTFESSVTEAKAELQGEKASKEAIVVQVESMRKSLLGSMKEVKAMQATLMAHNIKYESIRPDEWVDKSVFSRQPSQDKLPFKSAHSDTMSNHEELNESQLLGPDKVQRNPSVSSQVEPNESLQAATSLPSSLNMQSPMSSTHGNTAGTKITTLNPADCITSPRTLALRRKTFPSDGFSFHKFISTFPSVHHQDLPEVAVVVNEMQLRALVEMEQDATTDGDESDHGNSVMSSKPLRSYRLGAKNLYRNPIVKEKIRAAMVDTESKYKGISGQQFSVFPKSAVNLLSQLESPSLSSSTSPKIASTSISGEVPKHDPMDVPNSNAGKLRNKTNIANNKESYNSSASNDLNNSQSSSMSQVQNRPIEPAVAAKTIAVTKKPKPAFKVVELIPPTEDATAAELALRDSLIRTMSTYPEMTQNITYRAINASAPVLKKFSQLMTTCFECILRALSAKTQGLDYLSEVRKIFVGILRLAKSPGGPEEVETLRCSATASAESLMAGNKVHNKWRRESQIDEALFKTLDSCISTDDDEEEIEKKINLDFFGAPKQELGNKLYSEEGMATAVNLTLEAAEKMSNIAENYHSKFANDLINVLQDWATAKTAYLNMDTLVEVEKEKVRNELTIKLTALSEELNKRKSMYDAKCDQIESLQDHLKSLLTVEKKMIESEKKIEKLEKDEKKNLGDMSKLNQTIGELRSKLEVAGTKQSESESLIMELKKSLKLNVTKLKNEGEKIVELNQQLSNAIGSRDDWQAQYNNLLQTEAERKAGMVSVSVQFYPVVASVNLQTEFLTLPTELHTAACSNLDRMGKVKYPLPLVHCSSPVKSVFENNSLASDSLSNRTKTAFTEALRTNEGPLHDSAALHSSKSMPPFMQTTQSTDGIDSARSNVSSVSSISSLTSSTQSYGFYNGNMHHLDSINNRNLVPPPMYDLKTFLCGPSLAKKHHHHHHNHSSTISGTNNLKYSSSKSVKSDFNHHHHLMTDATDDKSAPPILSTGNKHRGSSDGRGNIMPLTMDLKNKFDNKLSSNRLEVSNSPTIPVSTSSGASLLQIGLPIVARTGTSGSNYNAVNNTQTSRSVNLQSSRTHSDHNIQSLHSNKVMNYGDMMSDSDSTLRKDPRNKSRACEDEKSVITLSSKSLKRAKQEYLSMV